MSALILFLVAVLADFLAAALAIGASLATLVCLAGMWREWGGVFLPWLAGWCCASAVVTLYWTGVLETGVFGVVLEVLS